MLKLTPAALRFLLAATTAVVTLLVLLSLISLSIGGSTGVAAQPQRGKDFYAILGVPRTATDKEIKAHYKKMARDLHPDRAQNKKKPEKEREEARKRFIAVTEAYEILSDDEKRKRFDETGMGMHGNEDRQYLKAHLFTDDFEGKQFKDKEVFAYMNGQNPQGALIFFWSPNFPDCIDASKPFRILAQKLKGTSIIAGSYRCEDNVVVCRDLYLGAPPTIVGFEANGGPHKRRNYQGRYELHSLMQFAAEFFSAGKAIPFPTVAPGLWFDKTPNPETEEMKADWAAEFLYDSRKQTKLAEVSHDFVAFAQHGCMDCDTELRYAMETLAETVPTVKLAKADCESSAGKNVCKKLGLVQDNKAWTIARVSRRCWFHTKKPFEFGGQQCEETEIERYTGKYDSKFFLSFVLGNLISGGSSLVSLTKEQVLAMKEREDAYSLLYVNRRAGIPEGLRMQWSLLSLYAARNPPKNKKGDLTLKFGIVECMVQAAGACDDVKGKSFPVLAHYPFTAKAKKRGPSLKTNMEDFANSGFMTLLRDAEKEAEPLRIHTLDNSNFHKKLAAAKIRNKRFFVMFGAGEWCPPCVEAKKHWPDMARQLKEEKDGKQIAIGQVDCDSEQNLCRSSGVDGFPSFLFYSPDRAEPVKYSGDRDGSAMANFALEMLTSRVVTMEPRRIMGITQQGGTLLVVFSAGNWCPPCTAIKPKFKKASNMIGDVQATIVDCDELQQFCQTFNIDGFPTIIFFHKGKRNVWNGNPMQESPESIANWVKALNK